MGRAALIAMAVAMTVTVARAEEPCDRPCRDHPKLVAQCFKVRGRMSLANGTPSVRIWRVGTKRILGVSEGEYVDPRTCNLPADLRAKLSWDSDLFGDFVVCPFARSRPDVMQLVCVDRGEHLIVRPREK